MSSNQKSSLESVWWGSRWAHTIWSWICLICSTRNGCISERHGAGWWDLIFNNKVWPLPCHHSPGWSGSVSNSNRTSRADRSLSERFYLLDVSNYIRANPVRKPRDFKKHQRKITGISLRCVMVQYSWMCLFNVHWNTRFCADTHCLIFQRKYEDKHNSRAQAFPQEAKNGKDSGFVCKLKRKHLWKVKVNLVTSWNHTKPPPEKEIQLRETLQRSHYDRKFPNNQPIGRSFTKGFPAYRSCWQQLTPNSLLPPAHGQNFK